MAKITDKKLETATNQNRRAALKLGLIGAGASLAGLAISRAQERLCATPLVAQPEGPFYPVEDQADKDTDLIFVQGRSQQAKGEVIYVQGVVKDQSCVAVPGVLVEIWQACATGKYNHPSDPNTAALDPDFQYWGKATTNAEGFYRFRTILPGAYPAGGSWIRPPHIHFKVHKLGYMELITQLYFSGNQLNAKDLILSRLPKTEQDKVVVPLKQTSDLEYPVAHFDISIEKIGG